jgi:hypothetical protein
LPVAGLVVVRLGVQGLREVVALAVYCKGLFLLRQDHLSP